MRRPWGARPCLLQRSQHSLKRSLLTSRRLMTLASYATVLAATLAVTFAQAPAPASTTPVRVRSPAAIDAKLARKKPPVAQRPEDLKRCEDRKH